MILRPLSLYIYIYINSRSCRLDVTFEVHWVLLSLLGLGCSGSIQREAACILSSQGTRLFQCKGHQFGLTFSCARAEVAMIASTIDFKS